MVMTSNQIAGMIGSQQAMFGNFVSYAQQITPAYAQQGPQQMMGNPMGGYGSPYGSPHGVGMGMAPPPPPQPMAGVYNPQSMAQGFMPAMGGMAYAAAMQPGAGSQVMGERMVGTGMNFANTIGEGLGWASTGAGVASMFGLGGAGVAMAGGLPVMGALAAGGYALNQMGTGYQQRQQVNRVLRRNFGGQMGIGGGRGGMGFDAEEMGGISSMVREMGTEDLFTNVEELTRVMDRTAQMGLYRGIQSAKDFRQKFKQTVDTLKEVATTMNTTLEEATGFMEQGRSMGFFSGAEINRNLMQTRFGAGATGLSVGQIQQMGSTGAQLGRMMGMRGSQGARAAQATGMQVAQGMEMGIFSDEMVAEATGGLTGGEAATAIATRRMEMNNRWLQSRAGQAMLAGLWDPESGGISQSRLRQLQSGQISIRQLRTIGRQNVAGGGGRMSEFFAQRERIAGELQAQGAGNLAIGAIAEHFSRRRGLEMDDPAVQRFVRRRTGASQAEVEFEIRNFQNMPQITERTRARMRQQMEGAARNKAMETVGIQGMERRISQWWEREVENPFREVGDQLTTQISRGIRQLSDDFEGRVKTQISEEAKAAYEQIAMMGEVVDPTNPFGGGGGKSGLTASLGSIRTRNAQFQTRRSQLGRGGGVLNQFWGAVGLPSDRDLSAWGLTRSASRGLGELFGARPTAGLMEQAEAMGITYKGAGGGYRMVEGAQKYRQRGAKGGETTLRGGRVANMDDVATLYAGAMDELMTSTEQMGFDEVTAQNMADRAMSIVTEKFSGMTADPAAASGVGGSPAERKAAQMKRIKLLGEKDAQLKQAFNKLKSWPQKAALLARLQERAGLAEDLRVAITPGGGDIRNLEEMMTDIRGRQDEAIAGLAGLRYEKEEDWIEISRTGTLQDLGKKKTWRSLGLSQETVRGLMQNETVRDNFQAMVHGTPGDKAKALRNLRNMANERGNELGDPQRKALKELTSKEVMDNERSARNLRGQLGNYLEAVNDEQGAVVQRREAEVGQQMIRSIRKNEWRFKQAGISEASAKIQAIAEARQRGDMKEAAELERGFYAQYAGDEAVQDVLAQTPGLEYMQAGVGATARLAQRLMDTGRSGATKTGRLLKTALEAAGLGDLGITQKELQNLAKQVKGGEAGGEAFMAHIRKLAKEKGPGFLEKLQQRGFLLEEAAKVGIGGVTEDEAKTYAARFGAGAAAKLRMEGAPEERMATSDLQQKILGVMKKSMVIQTEMARSMGVSAKALENIRTGEHWYTKEKEAP